MPLDIDERDLCAFMHPLHVKIETVLPSFDYSRRHIIMFHLVSCLFSLASLEYLSRRGAPFQDQSTVQNLL